MRYPAWSGSDAVALRSLQGLVDGHGLLVVCPCLLKLLERLGVVGIDGACVRVVRAAGVLVGRHDAAEMSEELALQPLADLAGLAL